MDQNELNYLLTSHARKGGKTSRRRQIARIRQFLAFCRSLGVREVNQVGKRHVHAWFEEKDLAATTMRDRFYAVALLWKLLGRGEPPRPRIADSATSPSDVDG